MKKIYLVLTLFLLVTSVGAADSLTVNINGIDFTIPSHYGGGDLKNDSYVYKDLNTFAILCVDTYLSSNYGFWQSDAEYSENLTVDSHDVSFVSCYNSYSKTNVSHLYFSVGESIYCICFEGSQITPEISAIVENAPESDLSSDTFYALLDSAADEYERQEEIDDYQNDNYYYISDSQNQKHDDTFMKWYLLSRLSKRCYL